MTEDTTKLGVSRRTLAKGAAWSVPAVAVVAAAPAYAKSGIIDPSFTPGTFCKHPGGRYSYYHAGFCFKNTSNVDVMISFDSFTVNETTVTAMYPSTLTVKAGEECCLNIDGYGFGDSANGTGTLAFSYEYGGTTIDGSVSTTYTNDLPPCSNIGQEHNFADTAEHKDIKCGTPAEARQRRTWAKTSEADSTELDADEPVEADKADTPVEKAAEAPKTETQKAEAPAKQAEKPKAEAPKAEEPAPAPEPKAEEPAPAPEPSEPADEA